MTVVPHWLHTHGIENKDAMLTILVPIRAGVGLIWNTMGSLVPTLFSVKSAGVLDRATSMASALVENSTHQDWLRSSQLPLVPARVQSIALPLRH